MNKFNSFPRCCGAVFTCTVHLDGLERRELLCQSRRRIYNALRNKPADPQRDMSNPSNKPVNHQSSGEKITAMRALLHQLWINEWIPSSQPSGGGGGYKFSKWKWITCGWTWSAGLRAHLSVGIWGRRIRDDIRGRPRVIGSQWHRPCIILING